jgi:hypothetical protein
MERNPEFDDIRPYYDDEVVPAIDRLLNDPEFKRVINYIFPGKNWEEFETLMRSFRTKHDFQYALVRKTIDWFTDKTAASIDSSGYENLIEGESYTYISNHRDILLDASILCNLLAENGHDTTEVAIGDNLLVEPWIETLVRLNKSFIVKRNVPFRQILESSTHLSKYIHSVIRGKKESIWIAQREGRAKDSNDRTQESLLKMLAMGSDKDFPANIEELNIVPVSLSYEYDPCDFLKAKEFQQKRDDSDFKKSEHDDLINMETGIYGYKGKIHFQFGHPINPTLHRLETTSEKNGWVTQLASIIDAEIFLNYRFYPINYIAYDRLWGENRFRENYTDEDIRNFDVYLRNPLDKIDLPNNDIPYLTERMLEMYAYPVKNQLAVKAE